ncbi:Uncharacterised protein (plasmid) [Legionella adelaidensis]|uniref:Uncharacterized protein n=1 Tax=Legionella adelaidensis TaxID=45056 RepID=A0A0W0R1G3_9GAMM|nr:hypothetical protein [Legionella adelaidensis]KTC64931.1 hypothetical protein Lade_1738 [Legionella adelaidensis]VEH85614.1 Uncharacterised protein [Legionella adelaidensis]
MPEFFQKMDIHGKAVDSYLLKHIPYDHEDKQHADLVVDCCDDVRKNLTKLQRIDKKIVVGLALASAASVVSFVFPIFSPLIMAGVAYAAYQFGLREKANDEYTRSIENLANCCKWTLGGENASAPLLKNEDIADMLRTIGPITTKEQLRELVSSKIANQCIIQAKQDIKFLDTPVSKEEHRNLFYAMYGYQQGGPLNIIKSLGFVIKNAFQGFRESISTKLEGWRDEQQVKSSV